MSYSNSVELSNTISVNLLERKSNLFSVFLSTVRKPLTMFSVEYPDKGIILCSRDIGSQRCEKNLEEDIL